MSVIGTDGFDWADSATDLTTYGEWATASSITVSSSVRVGTGKSIQFTNANSVLRRVFPANQSGKTLYAGVSYKRDSTLSGAVTTRVPFISFYQTDNNESAPQIFVALNTSYKLEIVRGATVLATGSTTIALNTAYYIEVKCLVHNSAGSFEIKINGTSEVSITGTDTQEQSDSNVLAIGLGYLSAYSPPGYFDDFYIDNSDGTLNNGYRGEQRMVMITPTSDSSVVFSRNTGASNYLAVDDSPGAPDEDTTYVFASTSGNKDEYGLSDLTGVSTARSIRLMTRAEKDDVNPKSFKAGIKSGATNQQVTHVLGVGYATYHDYFESSDGGTTQFNGTTVNSMLSTIEVV